MVDQAHAPNSVPSDFNSLVSFKATPEWDCGRPQSTFGSYPHAKGGRQNNGPQRWPVQSLEPLVAVQSLSHVRLFVTPWAAARQASLSFTISWSLLKLMSTECHPTFSSVAPFSSCLQSFPASGSLLMSWLFASGGQSIGASASASVLPMNIQD